MPNFYLFKHRKESTIIRTSMRYLQPVLNAIVDSCFAWFTPSWRREGHETAAALCRYINHFRPSIKEEKLADLLSLQSKLKAALASWQKEEVKNLTLSVNTVCEPMPGFKRNGVVEMVESFFVIMVVFLGIRTYYAQPFRIPTGSMQPSLNGIIVHPIEEMPSAPVRWWNTLTLGSSYIDEVADTDKRIISMQQQQKWLLFTETVLTFDDRSTLTIPAAQGTIMQYLREQGKMVDTPFGLQFAPYRAGETIMKARVDAGDMVIVNRMAYHFRNPERGETFVFDTRGINTSGKTTRSIEDQSSGTHYIKRLCGLPGDTVSIEAPHLLINGAPATENTINTVAQGKAPFNPGGYKALALSGYTNAFLTVGRSVQLRSNQSTPNLREYIALGDNTDNSLDSRYWGPVRQFNIIGPASFTLWPFTSHWGSIN